MMLSIFSCAIDRLHVIFGEMSVQVFDLFLSWFVFLLLSYNYSLYVLDINPLSDIHIFIRFTHFPPPHSVGVLSLDSVLQSTKVVHFDEGQFILFYMCFQCHVSETTA